VSEGLSPTAPRAAARISSRLRVSNESAVDLGVPASGTRGGWVRCCRDASGWGAGAVGITAGTWCC
jgi:hypothetical protein